MKTYLTFAVAMLMLITSIGCFGFLSKAHLDQAVISGDSTTRIAIFDEKIKSAKENIETNRRALKQMDDAVEQLMTRTTDEQGATKAANLRRNQQGERTRLQNEIAREQTRIQQLSEERAPIAAEVRKVEAEVGPIKYIAALIYGDNPDQSLLEKAVRWVIIILVIVFDPLAIFMLLASTESYKWEKYGRRGDPQEHNSPPQQPVNDTVAKARVLVDNWADILRQKLKRSQDHADLDTDKRTTEDMVERPAGDRVDDKPVAEVVQQSKIDYQVLDDADDEHNDEDPDAVHDSLEVKEAKRRWKEDNPTATLKEQRRLYNMGLINHYPWEDYLIRDEDHLKQPGYGQTFPDTADKGDMWVLTNTLPTTLHKYNGEKWIRVDKSQTDSYAYNDAYIEYLIQKISAGEYDPELLSDAERAQLESKLQQEL